MKSKIYSLKRSSFFFFLFLLLPFFSFSFTQEEIRDKVTGCYIYYYNPDYSVSTRYFNGKLPAVESHFKLSNIAVECSSGSCVYPDFSDLSYVSTNLYSSNTPVRSIEVNTSKYAPINIFPTVYTVYNFAVSLFGAGYRGTGFTLFEYTNTAQTRARFNFNYSVAVSDIASSTNTVFRQILLSHLSQIGSSVVNIDTGVSSLVPTVDRIEGINSGISENVSIITDYIDDINEVLNGTQSILTNISASVSSIPSYLHSNSNALERLHDDNVLANLYVFLGDDTSSWVGFCNWAFSQELLSASERDYFILEFQQTDPSVPPSRSYFIPASHRRFLAKSSLQGRVVAANRLRGVYQSMGYVPSGSRPWAQEAVSSIGNIFTEAPVREINYLSGLAEDWRDNLRQQLQDWKTSDEHGILNVKDKIDHVDSSIKRNFEVTSPAGPLNPLGTNTIPFTAFVTNFVVVPLTNTIDYAADRIITNDSVEAKAMRDLLEDKLFDPEARGINVRIHYPWSGYDQMAVKVHDDAFDVIGSGIDELNYNVSAVLGDMNSRWEKWFRLWEDWSPSVSTNIQGILDVLLNWTNTTVQLDHVLFQDYSNYVYTASFVELFSTLENDYPVCYSNLVKFGLSSSEDGGRWWNVLASSVSYDTAMISYVFSDMVELDRIARDNLGESPFSFLLRTLNDMPSKSQIEDYVSQASNATSQVEYSLASLSNSLNSVSNSYASVFNPFRGHFDSPGASVTFFKINDGHDGQYVTIPVCDQPDAWRYIRLGVSFGLVAVNILLFPKYLLMLFTLFIKAYRIGIKFFPDDR